MQFSKSKIEWEFVAEVLYETYLNIIKNSLDARLESRKPFVSTEGAFLPRSSGG